MFRVLRVTQESLGFRVSTQISHTERTEPGQEGFLETKHVLVDGLVQMGYSPNSLKVVI